MEWTSYYLMFLEGAELRPLDVILRYIEHHDLFWNKYGIIIIF